MRRSLLSIIGIILVVFSFVRDAISLDPREEIELGREVFRKIQEIYKFLNIPEVNFYVMTLGQRLASNVPQSPHGYRFFVIDQNVPNAFTIPGGYVFVNSGLIALMDREGELASVIAHEIAHQQARHIHKQIENQKPLMLATLAGMIAGALIGNPQLGQAIATGTMAGVQTVALSYSRENEREADQIGVKILKASKYSTEDAVSALKKLASKTWQGRPGTYDYLMTHPAINERIDYLSSLSSNSSGVKKEAGLFPYAKAEILFITGNLKELNRMINEAKQLGYSEDVVEYLKGIIAISNGDLMESKKRFETAWILSGKNFFTSSRFSNVLISSKQFGKARAILKESLIANIDNPVLCYRYASLVADNGDYSEALNYYMKIKDGDIFSDLDYKIGTVLGRLGRVGEAHKKLGDYYAKFGDKRLAIFHYEKALTLSLPPSDIDEIKRSLTRLKNEKAIEDNQIRSR